MTEPGLNGHPVPSSPRRGSVAGVVHTSVIPGLLSAPALSPAVPARPGVTASAVNGRDGQEPCLPSGELRSEIAGPVGGAR